VYAVGDAWRECMLNLAGCGKFSSDHTIPIRRRNLAREAVSGAMKRIGA
jgi:hypothetical protein